MHKLPAVQGPPLTEEIPVNDIDIHIPGAVVLVAKHEGRRVMIYLPDQINLVHGLLRANDKKTAVVFYDAKLIGPLADGGLADDMGMTRGLIHNTVTKLVRRNIQQALAYEQKAQLETQEVKILK